MVYYYQTVFYKETYHKLQKDNKITGNYYACYSGYGSVDTNRYDDE